MKEVEDQRKHMFAEIGRLDREISKLKHEKDELVRWNATIRKALQGVVAWQDEVGEIVNGMGAMPPGVIDPARAALAGRLGNAPGPCVCGILEPIFAAIAESAESSVMGERIRSTELPKAQDVCDRIRDRFDEPKGHV